MARRGRVLRRRRPDATRRGGWRARAGKVKLEWTYKAEKTGQRPGLHGYSNGDDQGVRVSDARHKNSIGAVRGEGRMRLGQPRAKGFHPERLDLKLTWIFRDQVEFGLNSNNFGFENLLWFNENEKKDQVSSQILGGKMGEFASHICTAIWSF